MADATGCAICDGGLAEPVDTLLFLGRSSTEIAAMLDRPREFEKEIRSHLFQKHVQRCSPENYQMLIVTYMGDIKKLLERELKRSVEKQDVRRIAIGFKGTQWAIQQIARMEGYLNPTRLNPQANNLITALNEFAKHNPDAAKRVQEATARKKPVLIPGPKPETVKSPVPKAYEGGARDDSEVP